MGPIWGRQDPGGLMLAPWTLLSGSEQHTTHDLYLTRKSHKHPTDEYLQAAMLSNDFHSIDVFDEIVYMMINTPIMSFIVQVPHEEAKLYSSLKAWYMNKYREEIHKNRNNKQTRHITILAMDWP